MRKQTIWDPTRSDTNRAVQSQKMIKGWKFGFRTWRNCTICVAKTKALISFAVTAKLICAFVFAYAYCWFSHAAAHLSFPAPFIEQIYVEFSKLLSVSGYQRAVDYYCHLAGQRGDNFIQDLGINIL